MTSKQRCTAAVWAGRGWDRQCTRTGSVSEGGKLWCTQHAPSAVKKRSEKAMAEYDARRAEERKRNDLSYAAPDLLAACKALVDAACNVRSIIHGESGVWLALVDAENAARAAIEKAEGGK